MPVTYLRHTVSTVSDVALIVHCSAARHTCMRQCGFGFSPQSEIFPYVTIMYSFKLLLSSRRPHIKYTSSWLYAEYTRIRRAGTEPLDKATELCLQNYRLGQRQ